MLHLRGRVGDVSHFVALQLQPGSVTLTDDSPGQVLRLNDEHAGRPHHHVVGIAVPGNWQIVDDHVVCFELRQRVRDDLLASRTRRPARRFGLGRVPAGDQPRHAAQQSDGQRPLHAVQYGQPFELVPFEIPQWLSLSLIVVIFSIAFVYARAQGPVADVDTLSEQVESVLSDSTEG